MHREPGRVRAANGGKVIKSNIDLRGLVHLGKMSGGYFITTFINQAIPFLVLPVLTRYLAPGQFANVALFSFYLAIATALTGASVPTVIEKHFFESDKKRIAMLIGNSLLIVLAFSLAAMLAIGISYPFLKKNFDLNLFWLLLVPLSACAVNVFSLGLAVMRNEKKRLLFGKHQIGNTVVNIAVSLLLVVVFLRGWQGRVWGIIVSSIVSMLLAYFYLRANGYVSFAISKKHLQRILAVALPLMPNSFQAVIIAQVGIFFIQLYFSKELLGVYAVAFQLAYAVRLLNNVLALSWSPYLFEQFAKMDEINRLYLARMFLALVALMLLAVAFITVFSGKILMVMTAVKYWDAKKFIPWFAAGFFFQGVYIFFMPFLIKFEKQKYISKISFFNMAAMIALNFWFIRVFGYMGIAYAFAVIYFLMFLAFARKAQQVFPLPWLGALKVWS
jgi:O-antigen/teichoic acid export membrane protein